MKTTSRATRRAITHAAAGAFSAFLGLGCAHNSSDDPVYFHWISYELGWEKVDPSIPEPDEGWDVVTSNRGHIVLDGAPASGTTLVKDDPTQALRWSNDAGGATLELRDGDVVKGTIRCIPKDNAGEGASLSATMANGSVYYLLVTFPRNASCSKV